MRKIIKMLGFALRHSDHDGESPDDGNTCPECCEHGDMDDEDQCLDCGKDCTEDRVDAYDRLKYDGV